VALNLRVGIAGLGDAGSQVVEAVPGIPGITLAAVADTRPAALETAVKTRGVRGYPTVDAMCASSEVDAIYVATPNKFHVEHALSAARNGKHVIVVKPLALTLRGCDEIIEAAQRHGVKLVYGHSRIYDPPVRKMAEIVQSGQIGRVIQINTWMYGGWLQRKPRLASELSTESGGGVVYRQAPHQADIVRCIGGGILKTLRAVTGRWDPHFDTEGNYSALAEFDNGTPATMIMNGYGFFSTSELTHGMKASGMVSAKDRITRAADESTKYGETQRRDYFYGGNEKKSQPFYGFTIVSCERGDMRQSPNGLLLYTAEGCKEVPCDHYVGEGRASVTGALLALQGALADKNAVYPAGRWAKATLESCLAILDSNRTGRAVNLTHQVPSPY
jgi:phthalate 4,5-cis-dihydrodiol dehydrogenase